jgi:hypothetical protein
VIWFLDNLKKLRFSGFRTKIVSRLGSELRVFILRSKTHKSTTFKWFNPEMIPFVLFFLGVAEGWRDPGVHRHSQTPCTIPRVNTMPEQETMPFIFPLTASWVDVATMYWSKQSILSQGFSSDSVRTGSHKKLTAYEGYFCLAVHFS